MAMLSRLRSLWRNLTHRDEVERELDAELRATLEILVDEKVATGLTASQAKRAASIELGGIEPIKDRVRDVRAGALMETLLQDTRYALRHLRRAPGFAAAAILTLAFGIGANTAMFSVLNALVIRPLPIRDPNGLISVTGRNERGQMKVTPIPAIDELAREGPLRDVCGYNGGFIISVEANGITTQVLGTLVTGQCMTTFGVAPILGRPILDEDAPLYRQGAKVVMLGHRFWTRMFGSDPNAIGKSIRAQGVELTVIGVLPPGFGGLQVDSGADLFAPFDTVLPSSAPGRRPGASEVLGRLKPGISFEEAKAQIETRWPAVLDVAVPPTLPPTERNELLNVRPVVQRMGHGLSGYRDRFARPLTLILALTGLLLVLACINLGGLLLARLSARWSELAVRLALGGSQARIAQQMLVESLVLSFSGAALAVPLSFIFIAPLASFIPPGFTERSVSFSPDWRVLTVTALAGATAGVVTSAFPIWVALRRRMTTGFMGDRTIVGTTSSWARGLLVTQVALSVMLLIGAGLLTRSLYLLQRGDLGVRPAGVLAAKIMSLPNGYRGIENASYYPALLGRIAALPGVRSAGLSRMFPRLAGQFLGTPIAFVGEEPRDAGAVLEATSPGFFETLGVPLLRGRFTSWSDHAEARQVAVVSESLARALAPDGDVVERHVRIGAGRAHQDVVIVGVVGNTTMGNPREAAPLVIYRSALQMGFQGLSPNLVVASDREASALAADIRQILKDGGREFAHEIIPLADILERAPSSERMSATLAGVIGLLAVLLALIGVHGTLAYSVSRRTREIGVRVAIGAAPGAVAATVLREALLLTIAGVAIGLPLAYMAARTLRSLLFGITQADPVTFAGVTLFFVAIGLAASIVPARRAARVDPVIALRAD